MAERVEDGIHIDAPVDTVHAVILAVEDYPSWANGVRSVDVLDHDDAGRAAQARFVVDTPLGPVGYTVAYTYGETEVSWQLVEGEMLSRLDGSYSLTARDGGTAVQGTLDVAVDLPVPASVTRKAAISIVERALASLKQRVEAAP